MLRHRQHHEEYPADKFQFQQGCRPRIEKNAGFSLHELMIVVGILLVLMTICLPYVNGFLQDFRTVNDARSIAAQLALARMRAASNSSKARLNFNITANTYQLEVWKSSSNAYQPEGGVANLSQGVTFGFGTITTPAGGQSSIAQTPQIIFNSRGLSVDSSGNVIGTAAIYIGNGHGLYCAVAASLGGQPTAWEYTGTGWKAL
jgi:prepilin-type N-terminal cleavage/methylation domain-containing protein